MSDLPLPIIALSLTNHVGSKTLRALLDHFGDDLDAILAADLDALQAVPGIGPTIARSIQTIDLPRVEQALGEWADRGISMITALYPGTSYPTRLRQIDDPPATLFMRGVWKQTYDRAVAVVGTRKPSDLATELATRIGATLAESGITVVSGLAEGIDTLAHEAALSVSLGTTIAVLGSGVLNVYPPQNRALAGRCALHGVVMSEVAPSAPTSSPRLVARNRIISGLSQAVIVVETGANGGAMHAARRAMMQGRPLFAVDLPASGNRALLDAGAQPLSPDLANLNFVLATALEG